mmetsp:Transcript_16777/g.40440  ORF Transcript_16777/g.40440 Transcript_16777/m.40440 type:complete len:279 (+) Transcript_16777:389-1225(+)
MPRTVAQPTGPEHQEGGLERGGGHDPAARTPRAWEPLGRDLQAPSRAHRQRHQEPVELNNAQARDARRLLPRRLPCVSGRRDRGRQGRTRQGRACACCRQGANVGGQEDQGGQEGGQESEGAEGGPADAPSQEAKDRFCDPPRLQGGGAPGDAGGGGDQRQQQRCVRTRTRGACHGHGTGARARPGRGHDGDPRRRRHCHALQRWVTSGLAALQAPRAWKVRDAADGLRRELAGRCTPERECALCEQDDARFVKHLPAVCPQGPLLRSRRGSTPAPVR